QGYLRGVSNLRRPLAIVVVANVLNVALEIVFVYGFHWGVAGSAAGTAVAQAAMAAAFVVELLRPHAASKRPSLREMRPMVPVGGAVLALDGILVGAGATGYLVWSMLAASALFIVLALVGYAFGWGIVGVWAALDVLIAARLALLGVRFAGRRWAVVGWG